jgi:hypothetical protein
MGQANMSTVSLKFLKISFERQRAAKLAGLTELQSMLLESDDPNIEQVVTDLAFELCNEVLALEKRYEQAIDKTKKKT